MLLQHLEQLDQRQRRLGLSVLVTREGIDPTAEDLRGLTLIERKTLANSGDELRIDDGRIDSATSRTASPQAGQKSPVTPGMTVLSPL
jgi:hypothetical protein